MWYSRTVAQVVRDANGGPEAWAGDWHMRVCQLFVLDFDVPEIDQAFATTQFVEVAPRFLGSGIPT